jgi:hypothetical protein
MLRLAVYLALGSPTNNGQIENENENENDWRPWEPSSRRFALKGRESFLPFVAVPLKGVPGCLEHLIVLCFLDPFFDKLRALASSFTILVFSE